MVKIIQMPATSLEAKDGTLTVNQGYSNHTIPLWALESFIDALRHAAATEIITPPVVEEAQV